MTTNSNNAQISITVQKKSLDNIEKKRKSVNRSTYIRSVLFDSKKQTSLRKINGAVYTPKCLAEYVADKALHYYFSNKSNVLLHKNNKFNVIDPACGDGELLYALSNSSILNEKIDISKSLDLFGIDIDETAIHKIKKRLTNYHQLKAEHDNGLCPNSSNNKDGWLKLNKKLKVKDGYDLIIANPPWGASIASYENLVRASNFSQLSGQFDTSDLFIESGLNIARDGGIIAFIIPDSLFSQERDKLRELLLSKTKIHFIGRFGEKLFEDVNRACAVIICEKGKSDSTHDIDCFRLSVEYRNLILAGNATFQLAEEKLSHKVEQRRFLNNKNYLFNIDIDSNLEKTFQNITLHSDNFAKYLTSTRGVELSKKGHIINCSECNLWSPLPSKDVFLCPKCKHSSLAIDCVKDVIIHKQPEKNSKNLVVGEHIQRYSIQSKLWIETTREGINYKNESIYTGDKILVRKTGIGISASIDYNNFMTNQVVYIFKLHNKTFPLEFFSLILNSRMAFFFIAMSNGEIEWKSHPYVTQGQILNFPIPNFNNLSPQLLKKILTLSNKLKDCLKSNESLSKTLDAQLEYLVAEVYGLTKADYLSIYKAIDKSQELLPVKALKSIAVSDIFKNKA
jgi:adenine-specific DNA-methyltransferase